MRRRPEKIFGRGPGTRAVIFRLIAGAVGIAMGYGQANPQQFKPVILNVVATDHAGHPVTDLQPGDLTVSDERSPQKITSLRLNSDNPPARLAILLDLLDLNLQQRSSAVDQLRQSLSGTADSSPLYLYLLVANGSLYPVHALPGADAPRSTTDDSAWVGRAGALLNQAMQKVSQVRAMEFRSHPEERFKAAYSALESMEQEMSRFPGRKQLLWITDGIPSSMRFVGKGSVDLSPHLRQLAARFTLDDIAIYTLDPGLGLATPNRDALAVLSAATGGRTFASSDITMALKQARTDAAATYLLEYGPPSGPNSEGKYHDVRVTCTRKGVRVRSEEAYLAELDRGRGLTAVAAFAPAAPLPPDTRALPPESFTFVGLVRLLKSRSMILELTDARFIMVDFRANARIDVHTGDRVNVRSNVYDGHGLLADSISLMQAATTAEPLPPQPSTAPAEADPMISQAREAESRIDRELPNFLCREVVKRYESSDPPQQWELLDTLSAEVLYSRQTGEIYRDIRVDGKATAKPWSALGGDISTGEFGSLLHSLLANQDLSFRLIREDVVDGIAAREYGFHVPRAQSDWKIVSGYQFIVPQYSGTIWFDRDANRVLRIERTAEEIPSAFPLAGVESDVHFGEFPVGSEKYLLPAAAETRICTGDRRKCSRKAIDFRDYRKFTGNSTIIY